MVMSVNTNIGAMVALQNLNTTNRAMAEVQNRINTGYKVAGPKDDGAIYAITQNMRGEVAGFQAVRTALNNSISIVDVAISAGQAVSDLLIEMKEKAVAALDQSLNTASRNALRSSSISCKPASKSSASWTSSSTMPEGPGRVAPSTPANASSNERSA